MELYAPLTVAKSSAKLTAEDDDKVIKYVRILGETLFKVDSHTRKDVIGD